MLKIKLARFGKKKQPHYRIVVNEARDKRDGRYVALLGHYAPAQNPKILDINVPEYQAWLAKGAQPTDTVAALFTRLESGTPFPAKTARLSRKAKAKQVAATAAAAEAANAPKEEAKAEVAEVANEATETAETVEAPAAEAAATETTAEVKAE
jgi:small subunit ribosomal protein S16